MILLLGGTTEALPIARDLTSEGYSVLLSTATDLVPRGRFPEAVERIAGMLNEDQIADLISRRRIKAVVDATHPYAAAVTENAWRACGRTKTPYLAYERPAGVKDGPRIHRVKDHEAGAAAAFSFARPVLLTIGVRNLAPYVSAARAGEIKLVARVMDQPESMTACRKEGLDDREIVRADGPFSVGENLSLLRDHGIGVMVTKDSGDAGGVGSKIAAALEARCRVVVVDRPRRPGPGYDSIPDLMGALRVLP